MPRSPTHNSLSSLTQNLHSASGDPRYTPDLFMGRRIAEKQLLSFIAMGNLTLLQDYFAQQDNRPVLSLGTMSKEASMQAKYLCVALITSACRAAIDAGVPEYISFSLSDSLIQEADRIHHPELFKEMMEKIIVQYCQAVHDFRLAPTSTPVRKCCEYMLLKTAGTVTLKELSDICYLSEHYISDLFRKELGIGALQYFHLQKLHYAHHLVLYSNLSITQIASSLSYPSASNFTQRFRKYYGTTPLTCRNGTHCKGEIKHDR